MYDVEELRVLEHLLNQYNDLTWRNMFETPTYEQILVIADAIIDKSRFVIFYDREWHIVGCDNRMFCVDINRANYELQHGSFLDVGRNYETLEECIYVRGPLGICEAQYNASAVMLVDSPNGPFIVPQLEHIGPRGTFTRCPTGEMGRRGDRLMVVRNNISDFIIDSSGELRIDQDGITFKEAYGQKWNKIATTNDMLKIYGTESLKRLLEYIASPSDSKMDAIVKSKINEILTKVGED